MSPSVCNTVLKAWHRLPEEVRSPLATEAQLIRFESAFGSIPADYRWFLANCGGGPIGSEWVDDIIQLSKTHEKFKCESKEGGWTMSGVFVIGWDGSGNPFGIQAGTDKMVMEDHQFGGIHEMATSFEQFLVDGLLPLPE